MNHRRKHIAVLLAALNDERAKNNKLRLRMNAARTRIERGDSAQAILILTQALGDSS